MSEKIKRHQLGSDAAADPTVYEEKDKSNYIGVVKSKNNKFIFIYSQATMSAELRFLDASKPTDNFKVFASRMKDVLYDVAVLVKLGNPPPLAVVMSLGLCRMLKFDA